MSVYCVLVIRAWTYEYGHERDYCIHVGGFYTGNRPLVSPCMCFMEVVFFFPSKVIKPALLNVTFISRYWTHVLAALAVSESSAALRRWGSSNNS